MGRKSITGGVVPAGPRSIQFDFTIDGRRFRPRLPWIPHEMNLRRAREYLARIKAQIEAGTFRFSDEFPHYRDLRKLPPALIARSCGEVFDEFLRHEEARLARDDLAPVTVASHRKILAHVWRPHLGHLPFLGVRYSILVGIADAYTRNKKTYNNAISALRRAFNFGYLDYPERRDPAASLKCARIGKKDRPAIDPFSIHDAEVLIAALHEDWSEAQGNYDELRFYSNPRPRHYELRGLGVTACNSREYYLGRHRLGADCGSKVLHGSFVPHTNRHISRPTVGRSRRPASPI